MTEETTKEKNSPEEIAAGGERAALVGLITHLLCVSTIQVAVDQRESNLVRVARDMEDTARTVTASLLAGADPAVAAVAAKAQKEIFEKVKLQMKKEARLLRIAAADRFRPQ